MWTTGFLVKKADKIDLLPTGKKRNEIERQYFLRPKINTILEFKIYFKKINFDSPTTKDKSISGSIDRCLEKTVALTAPGQNSDRRGQ